MPSENHRNTQNDSDLKENQLNIFTPAPYSICKIHPLKYPWFRKVNIYLHPKHLGADWF